MRIYKLSLVSNDEARCKDFGERHYTDFTSARESRDAALLDEQKELENNPHIAQDTITRETLHFTDRERVRLRADYNIPGGEYRGPWYEIVQIETDD